MQGKGPFVAQTVLKKTFKTLLENSANRLKTKTFKTLLESLLFARTCSVAQEDGKVHKKNRENHGSEFRKLMKLKKLARYARLGKLKEDNFCCRIGRMKAHRVRSVSAFNFVNSPGICNKLTLKTKTLKTLLESLLFVRTSSVAQEDGESGLSTNFLTTPEPSTSCRSFREEKSGK